MTLVPMNYLRTGVLVLGEQLVKLFWIKPLGKGGGTHEITEHHRELAAFGFGGFALLGTLGG
jgi:hypothetical protein